MFIMFKNDLNAELVLRLQLQYLTFTMTYLLNATNTHQK